MICIGDRCDEHIRCRAKSIQRIDCGPLHSAVQMFIEEHRDFSELFSSVFNIIHALRHHDRDDTRHFVDESVSRHGELIILVPAFSFILFLSHDFVPFRNQTLN